VTAKKHCNSQEAFHKRKWSPLSWGQVCLARGILLRDGMPKIRRNKN